MRTQLERGEDPNLKIEAEGPFAGLHCFDVAHTQEMRDVILSHSGTPARGSGSPPLPHPLQTQVLSLSHTHTHSFSLTLSLSLSLTHTHTLSLSHTHTLSLSRRCGM